jgi:flagellar basal-body rod modification protein FlgD
MAVDNVNFTTAGAYSAASSAKSNSKSFDIGIDDFFKLMAAQLQNQSLFDEVDNTQYLAQMAQFSTLSQMSELTGAIKSNLAISLIGREVAVATGGNSSGFTVGVVESVNISGGAPSLLVNGKYYSLADLIEIGQEQRRSEEIPEPDNKTTKEANKEELI